MKYILLLLLICQTSQAIDDDKLAHFGIAFGLTKLGNFVSEKGFGLTNEEARLFTLIGMSMLILSKEYTDRSIDGHDILVGYLGVLTANLINIKIDL